MKRLAVILTVLLLTFSLTACIISFPHPAEDPQPAQEEDVPAEAAEQDEPGKVRAKDFACEEMRITLTGDYSKTEGIDSYTGVFESSDSVVFVLRESKYLLGDIDMDRYASLVLEANRDVGHDPGDLHRKDGIPLFEYEYTNGSTGQTFAYYTTMFESEDAFWLVQFVCPADEYKTRVRQFHTFARSVTFNE